MTKRIRPAISVTAPIITDAMDVAAADALQNYIAGLASHSNTTTSRAEAERLSGYFGDAEIYLKREITKLDHGHPLAQEKPTLEKLVTSKSLSGMFNAVSAHFRNTLISDVVLLPEGLEDQPHVRNIFPERRFNQVFDLNGTGNIYFGFLKVPQKDHKGRITSAVSIPTMSLSGAILEAVAGHDPLPMLKIFQDVMTHVNHDMWHHLSSFMISDAVSHDFGKKFDKTSAFSWGVRIPEKGNPDSYERLVHTIHENVLTQDGTKKDFSVLEEKIDNFFTHLDRIAVEIAAKGEDPKRVVNYFGLAIGHALSRIYPLDHPLVLRSIDRLQEVDVSSANYLDDAAGMYKVRVSISLGEKENTPVNRGHALLHVYMTDSRVAAVVKKYESAGHDLLPAKDALPTYRQLRQMHLICASSEDAGAHIPDHGTEMRKEGGKAALDLLLTVSKAINFNIKQKSGPA